MQSPARCTIYLRQKGTQRVIKGHQESWSEYRPHRPRDSNRERKTRKTAHFQAVDPRAVLSRAVGIHPMAVGKQCLIPTAENPANNHITGNAGDAGGILLDVVMGHRSSSRTREVLSLTMALLSPLKRRCSRRTGSRRPRGTNRMLRSSNRLVDTPQSGRPDLRNKP